MPGHPADPGEQQQPSIDSLGGLFLVLFGGPIGYAVLAACAFIIARSAPWHFSAADIVFWGCVVAVPLAQQRAAKRQASVEGHAQRSTLRRTVAHVAVAAVVWIVAQSVDLF